MKVLELARAGFALKDYKPASPGYRSGGWGGFQNFFGRVDYAAAAGDLYENSIVLMCLYWYAEKMAQSQMRVEVEGQGGKWTVASPGRQQVLRCLRFPNKDYGENSLINGAMLSRAVRGDGYWLVNRDQIGRPAGFLYAPHFQIRPIQDGDGSTLISAYEFTSLGGGAMTRIPKEDVIQFPSAIPDPRNPGQSLSRLAAVLRPIVTDNESHAYTGALLRNMGIPGVMLIPKGEHDAMTPTQKQTMKDQWNEFRGDRTGLPWAAPMELTVHQLTMTPEQMALDKLQKIPRATIAGAMGLDLMVIRQPSDDKKYANFKEARESSVEDGLLPTLSCFSQVLTQFFKANRLLTEGERVAFDLSVYRELSEDLDALEARAALAWQAGTATRNRALAMVNEKPLGPKGDVFIDELGLTGDTEQAKEKQIQALKRRLVKRTRTEDLDADADPQG